MSVSLHKIKDHSAPKRDELLEFVSVNLVWEPRKNFGPEFDLDLSCFLLDSHGKIRTDNDFIFYNNIRSGCGSVAYLGDNTIGEHADSDAETIAIDFNNLDADIEKIVFAVSIYNSAKRNQVFGLIHGISVTIFNRQNGKLLANFDIGNQFNYEAAVRLFEFYKDGGIWKFSNINRSPARDLAMIAAGYGIDIQ